jgi:uncharacterized protein (TIGR03437 family)
VVRDSSRNLVAGLPIAFEASPGTQLVSAAATTDSNGEAQATLRVPAVAGAVLVSARVSSGMVTFQALVTSSTLADYPRLMQTGDTGIGGGTIANQGAMLAAVSSILRYHQNRGDLGSPFGMADPITLNQYLSGYCATDTLCDGYLVPSQSSGERIVNLWRLSGFAGANIEVVTGKPDLTVVREALGQGRPVLIAMALSMDGALIGSHYVAAIGVNDDGNIVIHDPNSTLARGSLAEYTAGFSAGGHSYIGVLSSVAQLVPRAAVAAGFLVASSAVPVSAASVLGSCGPALETPSVAAVPGVTPVLPITTFRALYCDGQAQFYQVDSTSKDPYRLTLTDLSAGGGRVDLSAGGDAAFKVVKSGSQWIASPADVNFSAASIVNAATFQSGLAPGGLAAIFGTGLARAGSPGQVLVSGVPAAVTASSPFQLNIQIPAQTAAGPQTITIRSPYGSSQQTVEIRKIAPGIFVLNGRQGAVVNPNGTINSSVAPLARGQVMVIYCTGLGAVVKQGAYQVAAAPVLVSLQGRDLQPAYAGLTPGFIGLYQVNVMAPADLPPGLDVPMFLRQDASGSNSVDVSVQ